MSYLEQLKQAVADAVAKASDKETIDRLASIQAASEGVEQESADLVKKNHELLTAYKEAVAHPGVTTKEPEDVTDVHKGHEDFADFLQSHIDKE